MDIQVEMWRICSVQFKFSSIKTLQNLNIATNKGYISDQYVMEIESHGFRYVKNK